VACVHVGKAIVSIPDAEGWARIRGVWHRWDFHSYLGPTFYRVPNRFKRWPEEFIVHEPSHKLWKAFKLWHKKRKHGA
jgi:hypothetical protein